MNFTYIVIVDIYGLQIGPVLGLSDCSSTYLKQSKPCVGLVVGY
jgi:hypothetical protein